MGMKSGVGGEIVQVQGGHIVRSTGRKDRHSKVYTAKGPRDRRVRLSAHTAIQFYDVQDRLGYDRPSKAVDWLIKKARSAIDNLAELPPWNPTGSAAESEPDPITGVSDGMASVAAEQSSFIPPPIDSDTMKSFFPTTSAPSSSSSPSSSSFNFQSYPHEMIQRGADPTRLQDLGLSLHSFQDQQPPNHHNGLFSGTGHVGFETSFQRIPFDPPQFSEHSMFAQRGTLQSSFSPSVRAWDNLPPIADQRAQSVQQSSVFGFPMFCIPERIRGEDDDDDDDDDEEPHGVVSERPSSSSSLNSTYH